MKPAYWLLAFLSLLPACSTVPTAPPVVQCPRVQPIQWDAPEPSFTARMQLFLSGSLPAQIDYGLPLPPAKQLMTPLSR